MALRRWAELTASEQQQIKRKLRVARRRRDFRWPMFAYDVGVKVWSLRRALEPLFSEAV